MPRIIVAVVSPRVFVRVLRRLQDLNAAYTVPRNLPVKCDESSIVITDRPEESVVIGECTVLCIRDPEDAEYIAETAYLDSMGVLDKNELTVGIDPGDQVHAFIVLAGGVVVDKGKATEKRLMEVIKKRRSHGNTSVTVRVGATRGNWERALKLASRLAEEIAGLRVEIVDETRTTRTRIPERIYGDRDLDAAFRIAMRSRPIRTL